MQNWPWQRWGRVWSRRENAWWPRWKSRRSQRSSRRWMRPKRSNGAPTAGRRPSSTAAGIQVTVITPASKPTGQNTWSPAHSQVMIKLLSKPSQAGLAHVWRSSTVSSAHAATRERWPHWNSLNKMKFKEGDISAAKCKKMQRLCSHFILCFSFSLGFAAGDRGRAQLRSFSQVNGPLACHTDPSLSSRIHIRQKQLSHICGQEQRQCRGHSDLTDTTDTFCKTVGLARWT